MKSLVIGMYGLLFALRYTTSLIYPTTNFSEAIESKDESTIQYEEYAVPQYSGFKSFMSYKTFRKNSIQYKLQQQAVTDEDGFRKIDGYYIIAIGSFFNATLGQRVNLTLENGESIKCIVGDKKADKDTDARNIFSRNNCMSEFVVDIEELEGIIRSRGDVSFHPDKKWNSPVTKVILLDEYLEELWQSQD